MATVAASLPEARSQSEMAVGAGMKVEEVVALAVSPGGPIAGSQR